MKGRIALILVLGLAGVWVAYRAISGTTGTGYYMEKPDGTKASVSPAVFQKFFAEIDADPDLTDQQKETKKNDKYVFSKPRTIGLWLAAFLTLAMFSFLYRDNPFYKFAEHVFVGISAGYWMVVAFWQIVVPNMLGKLFPAWTKFTFRPRLDLDEIAEKLSANATDDGLTATWWQMTDTMYWVPVILGIMLLWRLAPKGGWIARWPLAFILGTTAGLRLVAFLEADFLAQISATILPLVAPVYDSGSGELDLGKTFYASMNNILIIGGVCCGLVYFFFSLEHKGIVGRVARVGIWVLMITFGAGFGMTVMGRIALLVGRFEFLVIDWLNVVPP